MSNEKKLTLGYEIKMEEDLFYKPSNRTVRSVLFFSRSTLVVASQDHKIYIYDVEKNQEYFVISDFSNWVYHLTKFSTNTFYACSKDSFVRGYEFDEHWHTEKIFEAKLGSSVNRMLKLNDEQILCYVFRKPLVIVNVKDREKKIVQTPMMENSAHTPKGLILSNKFANCFYIATKGKKLHGYKQSVQKIKLINFVDYKIVKEYVFMKNGNTHAWDLTSFINSDNVEILIAGCKDGRIYFFNSETCKIILEIYTSYEPRTLALLKKSILFVGDFGGNFSIFRVNGEIYERIFLKRRFHTGRFYELKLIEKKNDKVKICSCAAYGEVKVSSFYSDMFDFVEFDELDRIERIDYLKENYCHEINIKFQNSNVFVNRVFMIL